MAFDSEVRHIAFTDPVTANGLHMAVIGELVGSVPAGGSIRVVISHFSKDAVADALIAARTRGVDVGIIIQKKDGNGDVVTKLRNAGVNPVVAEKGCFGLDIHTKLLLLSTAKLTGGATMNHVVVAGSFNLASGSEDQHQNTFVIADERLFTELRAHWSAMKQKAQAAPTPIRVPTRPPNSEITSTSGLVKCYLFPRGDTYVNIINNVQGSRRNFLFGESPRIRVAMARWTAGGQEVFNALSAAALRGCSLELALRDGGEDSEGTADSIKFLLLALRTTLAASRHGDRLKVRFSTVGDDVTDIHSKYVIVDGRYGEGSTWETNVWSGSPNWTDDGLNSNDEILFKFRDAEVHRLFAANHARLMTQPGMR